MLRSPEALREVVAALVRVVDGRAPVTVKMRSGFDDTSLFDENCLALQEAGVFCITVHPRTRAQGYRGRADWDVIARAKQLLRIPVVRTLPCEVVQTLLCHESGIIAYLCACCIFE